MSAESEIDRNQGVLGSLNRIGADTGDGVLQSVNGLLLPAGHNLVGRGTVDGAFENQGYVEGSGSQPDDRIAFTGDVTGSGDYADNVLFSGTLSPGNSPAAVSFESLAFGAGIDAFPVLKTAGMASDLQGIGAGARTPASKEASTVPTSCRAEGHGPRVRPCSLPAATDKTPGDLASTDRS